MLTLPLAFNFRKPRVLKELASDHIHDYSSVVDAFHAALSIEVDCLLIIWRFHYLSLV